MSRRARNILTNPALAVMRQIAARADEVPPHLAAIHRHVTHPLEGGLNTWDSAGVTYRGITAATFQSVMAEHGVELTIQQSRSALLAIARHNGQNGPAGDRIFEAFSGYVHYTRYLQRPGFDDLPVPFQAAIYDTSFNRGNGSTLIMLLRMAERNGHGPYPGLHSMDAPFPVNDEHPVRRAYHPTIPRPIGRGRTIPREDLHPAFNRPHIDADPLVLERILDEHQSRVRDRHTEDGEATRLGIIPSQLHQDLLDYGIDPQQDGITLVSTATGEPIDWSSEHELSDGSAQIRTPFDDRLSLLPPGDPERAGWDALMRQAVEAANAMSATMTPDQIIEAFEHERRIHFNQIIQVEPSNSDNIGWFTRINVNQDFAQNYLRTGNAVTMVASNVGLPLDQGSIAQAVSAFGIDTAQPDIAEHLRIISGVLSARNVQLTVPPTASSERVEIVLSDILPDIDIGNPNILSDNTVMDTNSMGEEIPTYTNATAIALVDALRQYYDENATTAQLESVDIEALEHIRIDIQRVGGIEYVSVSEVGDAELASRAARRAQIDGQNGPQ